METPRPQVIARSRILGSAGLLAITLWLLPTDSVWHALSNLRIELFVFVLASFLACHVAAAAKWWLLLNRTIAPGSALTAHFAGLAGNLCLPGVAGGDVVRAGLAMRHCSDATQILSASIADRLVDTLALVVLSGVGLALLYATSGGHDLPQGLATTQLFVLLGGLTLALFVFAFAILPRLASRLASRNTHDVVRDFAERVAAAFSGIARRRTPLVLASIASIAIQAALVFLAMRLAGDIGAGASAAAWLFAWPMAKLLAVLPISVAGIGVREASLAALMAQLGVDPSAVVAASLVWQAVLFAAGFIGALIWLIFVRRGDVTLSGVGDVGAIRPNDQTLGRSKPAVGRGS